VATAEALLAQTVTRPDAAARRPAHESAAAESGQSFADILDAETTIEGDAAPVAAASVQPAPAPNAATQLALLAGIEIAAPAASMPEVSAASPSVAPNLSAAPATGSAIFPQPANTAESVDNPTAAKPAAAIAPAAPGVATATAQAPVAPIAPADTVAPFASKAPAAEDVTVATVAEAATPVAPAMEAAVAAAPETLAVTASVVGKPAEAPAAKPIAAKSPAPAPAGIALSAPRTVVQPETATPVEAVPIVPSQPRLEDDAPAATPSNAVTGQPPAPAANNRTGPAAAVAADIKADVAGTSSTSTSATDALTAARTSLAAPATPAATPATPPQQALQSAPAVAVQVYTRFVERFDGRAQRFEVSLQPAELGRVDVRIEVGADKKVHAVLAAHDSAALTDLMRGQRSLERALSDAGIDLAKDGLKFELSDNTGRNASGWQRGDAQGDPELAHAWRGFTPVDVAVDANSAEVAAVMRPYTRSSRLDLVA
jgi:flagellar hook-length control protein FliK